MEIEKQTLVDESSKDLNQVKNDLSSDLNLFLPSLNQKLVKNRNLKFISPSRVNHKLNIKIHDFSKDNLDQESGFIDDWSKESCQQFFVPVEAFLDKQLKREKSSRRRCSEKEKLRSIEYKKKFIENSLRDFDEKINLNLLLKTRDSTAVKNSNSTSTSDSSNYRALIAEEIARNNSTCFRCKDKNKRYEDNLYENSMKLDGLSMTNMLRKKKSNLPNIQSRSMIENISRNYYYHHPNSVTSHLTVDNHLKENVNHNLNSTNNFAYKSRLFETDNSNLLFNLMPSKKPVINKAPIVINRKAFY